MVDTTPYPDSSGRGLLPLALQLSEACRWAAVADPGALRQSAANCQPSGASGGRLFSLRSFLPPIDLLAATTEVDLLRRDVDLSSSADDHARTCSPLLLQRSQRPHV